MSEHRRQTHRYGGPDCMECDQGWPCDASRLEAENERLRALLSEVRPYVPGGQLARRVFEALEERS